MRAPRRASGLPGQGNLYLAWSIALSCALWLFPSAAAADIVEACVDNDAKWAPYNSTCSQMKWLCSNAGYGNLVRKWCPRTCGLCVPSPAEAGVDAETDDDDDDDTVVLIAGRPGPRAAATLEFSVAWKAGTNTTKKLMREDSPRSRSAVSPSPPSNSSWNGSIAKANLTVEPSEVVGAKSPLKTPTQWKITV